MTAQELQHAQETRWTAEALSHLVVRSETEWGGGLGKWEELSPLMKKLLWLWQAEMERIGKLQWWEQAAGIEGFPKEPNPWHFHPVGVVGNFSNGEVIDGLIAWGKKVSVEFKQKVIVISRDLGLDPSYLMSAMAFETGETFRADIRNAAGSGATGLIQFMPNTAINLGTTTTQLARMSNVDQLDYVKKYFLPKQGRLHTLEDVYCMIFYPQAIGKPDNYIIAHKKKVNSHGVQVDDPIYMQNAGFDAENVGYITKYQISGRLREKYSKGMSVGYIG